MEERARKRQDLLTRRRHPDRTCGVQQTRHLFAINASNTRRETINGYVPILSQRREYRGVVDESKITWDHYSMLMTTQTNVTHLLRALMMK